MLLSGINWNHNSLHYALSFDIYLPLLSNKNLFIGKSIFTVFSPDETCFKTHQACLFRVKQVFDHDMVNTDSNKITLLWQLAWVGSSCIFLQGYQIRVVGWCVCAISIPEWKVIAHDTKWKLQFKAFLKFLRE